MVGYVEIILALSQSFPILIDYQNVHNIHSLAIASTFKALIHEMEKRDTVKLMVIFSNASHRRNEKWLSQPLVDILSNHENLSNISLQRWTHEDVLKYLQSKEETNISITEDVAQNISLPQQKEKPGYIAELVDWLEEDETLRSKLPNLTTSDFIDLSVDEEELEESSSESEEDEKSETDEKKYEKIQNKNAKKQVPLMQNWFPILQRCSD